MKLEGTLLAILFVVNASYAQTVTIGKQIWHAKNLNVFTFRNGDPIPEAKTDEEWSWASDNEQPAWCYYNNDPANGSKYGKLYNWYAVNDPRGLAPAGYHIPTKAEWDALTVYLGGEDIAGNAMKSTSGWRSYTTGGSKTCPNCETWDPEYRRRGATCRVCKDTRLVSVPTLTHFGNGSNSSKFSGLPGGSRWGNGQFNGIGDFGNWWSSRLYHDTNAWFCNLNYKNGFVYRHHIEMGEGYSVRCIKD
jgi:uncharacterized protein (TIGR02145 family)